MRNRKRKKKTQTRRQSIEKWKKAIYIKKLREELKREDKNETVIELYKGTITYDEYLKSEHWKQIRKLKLKDCNNACEVCGEDGIALTIHHNNYDTLGHERIQDLSCLCPYCHKDVHDKIRELASKHFMRRMLSIVLKWDFKEPDDLK